jgi:outer membrane biosynthesis protein TonB
MAELFTDLDLDRRAPRAHRMLRTLGGSLVLHAAFILALIYVPAVRDTFQLASALSGLKFVDAAYAQTDVRERAIIINANDKLYYPPGYFEQAAQNGTPSAVAPPVNDVKLVSVYKPEKPTPTPTPVPTPSPAPSVSPSPEIAQNDQSQPAGPGASPTASPNASPSPADPQTNEQAEQALTQNNQPKFPPINTRPFTDLLQKGKDMKDAGEIDLTGTLEMTVEADRRDDGTLMNVEITGGSASDAKLKELAKAFVAALSDSKALAALVDTHHLRMQLTLDEKEVAVRIVTELESAELAEKRANGYRGAIMLGAFAKKGKDEEVIFRNLKVSVNDKQVGLTMNMPRKAAGDLLSKLTKKTEPGPAT